MGTFQVLILKTPSRMILTGNSILFPVFKQKDTTKTACGLLINATCSWHMLVALVHINYSYEIAQNNKNSDVFLSPL